MKESEEINETALMKVYEGIKHTEIAEEFILPDYLPDIKRIIRAEARPKIDGKFITSGKVDFEGDIVCHMIYCDEENKLKNVSFTVAFSDGIEIEGTDEECIANLIPSPRSVNFRMLNPRRISMRVRLDTECTVWCLRKFTPEIKGEISPFAPELKTQDMETMKIICSGESGLNVTADLEADGALPEIGEVIHCNVDMSFYECKGSDGKVLCRGDMPITIFYSTPQSDETESESYTVLYRKMPVAQVVGAENVDESYECMARGAVDDVKINIAENGFGEKRILELDISYRIYLNCVSKDKVTVTKDIYALDRNVETVKEETDFCRLCRTFSTSFGANKVIKREELALPDIENIYEVTGKPEIENLINSKEEQKLILQGNVPSGAVVKGSEGIENIDFDVPLRLELDNAGIPDSFTYNCDAVCMSARGRIDSENIYIELEIQVNIMILGVSKEEILKSAEFFKKEDVEELPQMRFYYPSKEENLWNIGKHFGVSQEKLKSANNLEDDKTPEILLIPTK